MRRQQVLLRVGRHSTAIGAVAESRDESSDQTNRSCPESRRFGSWDRLRVPIRDGAGALFCRDANTLRCPISIPINAAIKQVLSISPAERPCPAMRWRPKDHTNMAIYYYPKVRSVLSFCLMRDCIWHNPLVEVASNICVVNQSILVSLTWNDSVRTSSLYDKLAKRSSQWSLFRERGIPTLNR